VIEELPELGTNYGADVMISEDGTRMAGSFFASTDPATLFDGGEEGIEIQMQDRGLRSHRPILCAHIPWPDTVLEAPARH